MCRALSNKQFKKWEKYLAQISTRKILILQRFSQTRNWKFLTVGGVED